ncbi:MAG: hypothetical protein ACT4OI_03895 [Methanobacteriota archaeon]
MARGDASWPLAVAVLGLALVGLVLAVASLAMQRSGGGMMGGMLGSGAAQDPGAGGFEWGVLALSAVVFVVRFPSAFEHAPRCPLPRRPTQRPPPRHPVRRPQRLRRLGSPWPS